MLGVGASAVDRKFYPASLDRNTGLHLLSNAKCIFDLKFIAFVYSPYVGRLGCIHYCFCGEGKPDSFFFPFPFFFRSVIFTLCPVWWTSTGLIHTNWGKRRQQQWKICKGRNCGGGMWVVGNQMRR